MLVGASAIKFHILVVFIFVSICLTLCFVLFSLVCCSFKCLIFVVMYLFDCIVCR